MKFNYMGPDGQIFTSVSVNNRTKEVRVENFTNDILDRAFGVKEDVTYEDVWAFFESRCFPSNRANADQLLHLIGLRKYDPIQICKKTKGASAQDGNWIDFVGDR